MNPSGIPVAQQFRLIIISPQIQKNNEKKVKKIRT